MENYRHSNQLRLEYSLVNGERIVVKVYSGDNVREADSSWASIEAALDSLLVPVIERIGLLKEEISKAPTVKLFGEYLTALKELVEKQKEYAEYLQTTAENEISISSQRPLSKSAKKRGGNAGGEAVLGVSRPTKIIQLREHFTPKVEVSMQAVKIVLDNLVERQYITAESRNAFALAMGWSDARAGAGEMVIWLRNVYVLRYMMQTLLGKEETELERPVMSSGSLVMLPAGIYGRKPLISTPTLNDRHWKIVSTYFMDNKGRTINADSLRSTRYPADPIETANFKEELLSCFAPIFLSPAGRKTVFPLNEDQKIQSSRGIVVQR